jgi:hypothetical protein
MMVTLVASSAARTVRSLAPDLQGGVAPGPHWQRNQFTSNTSGYEMYLSFELAAGCDRDASRYRISISRLGRRRASHDSCCTCWQPAVNLTYNERDRGAQEY